MSRLTAAEHRRLHQLHQMDVKRFLAGVGNPAAPAEPRHALRGLAVLIASGALLAAALAGALWAVGVDFTGIQFGSIAE